MTVDGCTDGAVLLAFLREVLVPQLRPGQVLIMDNLQAHHVAGVADACAAAGVRLLYLPPYLPDLSPIEEWALEQAIAEALAAITSQDARGWFAHAGYWVVSN
jgi:transposase